MNFTEQQEEKIFSNLDEIVAYIKEEIQPKIPDGETVSAEFRSNGSNLGCEMNITNCDIEGYVGYFHVHFERKKRNRFDSAYDHAAWAVEFVLNWKEPEYRSITMDSFNDCPVMCGDKKIKEQLLDNLDKMLKERERIACYIDSFEV